MNLDDGNENREGLLAQWPPSAAIGAEAGVSPAVALAVVKLTARARAVNSGLRMIMGKHLVTGLKD